MSLTARVRPAAAEPEGALVLFHGRGADEHDLFLLLDALDPERRLVGATPRAPLSLPPGGSHWYVLGGIGTHPDDVMHMKRTADRLFGRDYRWSVLGAGAAQMKVAAMAASMGGHVRVGLEDSLWIGKGRLAESNAQQVHKVRGILEGLGLSVATPDEAREILQLKGRGQVAL